MKQLILDQLLTTLKGAALIAAVAVVVGLVVVLPICLTTYVAGAPAGRFAVAVAGGVFLSWVCGTMLRLSQT